MRWLVLFLVGCGPSQSQLAEIRTLFEAQEPMLIKADKAFSAAVAKRPQPSEGAACKTPFRTADESEFADRLAAFVALTGHDGPLQASNVLYFTPKAVLDRVSSGAVAARREQYRR